MPTENSTPPGTDVAAAGNDFNALARLRWMQLDSSCVAAVAYDRDHRLLYVQMHSSVTRAYVYQRVQEAEFMTFITARSAGGHFARHVRNKYQCTRLELAVTAVAS